VSIINTGFGGHRHEPDSRIPPGQYETDEFPVLSAGPTPDIDTDDWNFTIRSQSGQRWDWNWDEFTALPSEEITRDISCVTRWTKLDMRWRGVAIDTLLENVEADGDFVMARSYGGYTTNVPLEDLTDGRAWIAFEYDGEPLDPEHGGPARLLVPHLYFWKSAKWVRGLDFMDDDEPGFWEQNGYHIYGDPWKEERYS
jgi:DMSO/TMAO reductase YedYZ molybdopterin-dependent catalytic subunit